MSSRIKTLILAAAATVALLGGAEAQIGRSSTNPEAGPAGATMGRPMMMQRRMTQRRMMRRRAMRHRMMRHRGM